MELSSANTLSKCLNQISLIPSQDEIVIPNFVSCSVSLGLRFLFQVTSVEDQLFAGAATIR